MEGTHLITHETAIEIEGEHTFAEAATTTGLDSRKMGIWMFIASEVIFFMALIATYVAFRGRTPVEEGIGHLDLNVASLNTFVLLASSLTMVLALAAIRDGKRGRMIGLLIATAVLGILFLSGQVYEYSLLLREGITPDTSIFGATFFTTTGFHGAHVSVGVLWIIAVLVRALRGGVTPQNNLSVEMAGLYWHFVDLVWVVLFTTIYLIT